MLGTACFRLCSRGSSTSVSYFHHSGPHPHSWQTICRNAPFCRSISWQRYQAVLNTEGCRGLQIGSPLKRSCSHTRTYVEGGNELRCATIWHGLLPSHHPSIIDQNVVSTISSVPSSSTSESLFTGASHTASCRIKRALSFPHDTRGGIGRFAMAARLLDGSWNVAWDARPARWLHGRHSAWLLFGVCTCFSEATSLPVPLPSPLLHLHGSGTESINSSMAQGALDAVKVALPDALPAKQVYTDYSVTGIPGDGRCLFRAIAHGACILSGKPAPDESMQRDLADSLRSKVVEELIRRRSESEWFIEENFDSYVNRMREHYIWGGEPELLMASHVLKLPITVHLFDRSLEGLISIAEYGLEYGTENPIRVLYHGFGHYDAVQIPSTETISKL